METFRIPQIAMLKLLESLVEDPGMKEFRYVNASGNILVGTRLTGLDPKGRTYDTWEFIYNPED